MTPEKRYNSVSVILHWLMALAFFGMLASGLLMVRDGVLEQQLQFQMYQIHKATGVVLLWAVIGRLLWRLTHKVPALPSSINGLEKFAAKAGHWALYLWMFALPFSGWLMVSSSPYGLPTMIYGLFEWPHIPRVAGEEGINKIAKQTHMWMAYGFIALISIHILAVIKHAAINKHNLLPRMWFGSFLAAFILMPVGASAESYTVLPEESSIKFSGEHAGKTFEGVFEEWSADINFNSDDLENSKIKVVIKTASAKTGNDMYDGTLPSDDWFDVEDYPESVFESEEITKNEEGFVVNGTLSMKGETVPASFPFSLFKQEDKTISLAEFSVNRMDMNIGMRSDPDGKWVSEDIKIQLKVVATP